MGLVVEGCEGRLRKVVGLEMEREGRRVGQWVSERDRVERGKGVEADRGREVREASALETLLGECDAVD